MDLIWFKEKITDFVAEYPRKENTVTSWLEPLVACASADDPEFARLEEVVSPTHALPSDLLPDAHSVVAYFIPFTAETIKSNVADREASRTWAVAYVETNRLIVDLNQYIYEQLAQEGYSCSRIPPTHNFDPVKLVSDWSHRHVAFIAGLGTLGHNNMLITEKGCCGRVGSIVTNARLKPTVRPTEEYCLYKKSGICQVCVKRCVNEALGKDSFDRHRCYEMCLLNEELHSGIGKADVCGKCLVGLPCSMRLPEKAARGR